MIQVKVSGLKHLIGRISEDLVHRERHSVSTDNILKKSPSIASPRFSTCTSRPSVDIRSRHPSLLSKKNAEVWEEKAFARSRSSTSAKQGVDIWSEPTVKSSRNPIQKGSHKSSGFSLLGSNNGDRQTHSETRNSPWNIVKTCLLEGDLESAYVEALCSAEELILIELLDRTGPVLDCLSHKTATDVLSTLASYFLEQRFINSVIPWLYQASYSLLIT